MYWREVVLGEGGERERQANQPEKRNVSLRQTEFPINPLGTTGARMRSDDPRHLRGISLLFSQSPRFSNNLATIGYSTSLDRLWSDFGLEYDNFYMNEKSSAVKRVKLSNPWGRTEPHTRRWCDRNAESTEERRR